MRVNHNTVLSILEMRLVVSDLCKDTKMRVNHNRIQGFSLTSLVVSDLCKDTKMRVNHNLWDKFPSWVVLFLIYAKILK